MTEAMGFQRDLRVSGACAIPAIDRPQTAVFIQHRPFFGDVLMLAPLLHSLRRTWPERHLVAYSKYDGGDLLLAEGYVDELVRYRRADRRLIGDLRQRELELLVSLRRRANGLNPLIGRLAGARHSVGYRSLSNTLWFSRRVPYRHWQYRADKYADLARALGLEVDLAASMCSLHERGDWRSDHPGRHVVLMPCGSSDQKQWGIERYLAVAERLLAADPQSHVVVVMGGRERELGYPEAIAAWPLAERCELVENAAVADIVRIVADAALVLGNDCGPMHVAQMLGTPLVVLFGNWDGLREQRIPCWFRPRRGALCLTTAAVRPITDLGVDAVHAACRELLRDPQAVGPDAVRLL